MSSYLARLVDRGVGAHGGAVSPRLAPVFPLGRAAGPQGEETDPGLLPEAFVPGLPPPRTPVPHPSGVPAAAATAASVRTGESLAPAWAERESGESRGEPSVPRVREPALPRLLEVGEPAAEQPSPAVAGSEMDVRMPIPDVTVAVPNELEAQGEGSAAMPEGRAVAKAVPRPDPERDPLTGRAASRAAAAEPAPQIEVRIGRVEVRRPPEPDPFSWPSIAPQAAPAPGFDRLAAARRYVDRRWN